MYSGMSLDLTEKKKKAEEFRKSMKNGGHF
jgi:hypothetical protein